MITIDQVKRELSIIINENPGRVYQKPLDLSGRELTPKEENAECLYVHYTAFGDRPGCLIGQWLSRFHGVTIGQLRSFEGEGVEGVIPAVFPEPFGAADGISRFLFYVQGDQDRGVPWGDINLDNCAHHARRWYGA